MKTCSLCKIGKPFEAFTKTKYQKDGHTSRCKLCTSEQLKLKRAANPEYFAAKHARYKAKNNDRVNAMRRAKRAGLPVEKIVVEVISDEERYRRKLASRLATYQKNKTKVLAVAAVYRQNHLEEERVLRRAHYERNREKNLANCAVYRVANLGKYNAYAAKRRTRKMKAQPAWADEAAMMEIYEVARWLTANSGEPHEVDHVVPLQGKTVCGLHCEANLQILTTEENRRKSNRYWPDMW